MKQEMNLSEAPNPEAADLDNAKSNAKDEPEVNLHQLILHQGSLISKLEARVDLLETILTQSMWAVNETALVAGCLVQHLVDEDDPEWKNLFEKSKKEMLEAVIKGASDAETGNNNFIPVSPDIKSG